MTPFRKARRDSVPDPTQTSNSKLLVVRIPPMSYDGLERLVQEGFVLKVEDAVSDAIRRYLEWARREIRRREKFRERTHTLDLDGWKVDE